MAGRAKRNERTAPRGAQVRQRSLGGIEEPHDFDIDGALPVVTAHFADMALVHERASRPDDGVHAAVSLNGCVQRCLDLGGIGYVDLVGARVDALFPDLVGDALCHVGLAPVADCDRYSSACELKGNALSDATATAKNQCRAIWESALSHLCFSFPRYIDTLSLRKSISNRSCTTRSMLNFRESISK
ncbi:hypothetical protein D9M71_371440 [compost metagenome]